MKYYEEGNERKAELNAGVGDGAIFYSKDIIARLVKLGNLSNDIKDKAESAIKSFGKLDDVFDFGDGVSVIYSNSVSELDRVSKEQYQHVSNIVHDIDTRVSGVAAVFDSTTKELEGKEL